MFASLRRLQVGAWFGAIAVVFVFARYYSTLGRTLRDPLNGGNEALWVKAWMILAVAVVVSLAIRRVSALRVWALLLLAAVAAILVLSGAWPAALVAAWLMLLAILLGDRLLAAIRIPCIDQPIDRIALGVPLGLVMLAATGLILAALGLFTPAKIGIMLAAVTLMELRHARALGQDLRVALSASPPLSEIPVEYPALLILSGLAFLGNLMWAVAPEIQFDSLNYHLPVPRAYLEHGRLVDLSYFYHSYFAHSPDMLFGLSMALHDEIAAKLLNLLTGVAAALSVLSLGRMLFGWRVGSWAAALFYTTPLVGALTSSTYTDVSTAFFLTAMVAAFVRWKESQRHGWVFAAGILAGSAVGIKLNALYAMPGFGLALLWHAMRGKGMPSRKVVALILFAAAFALACVPWYLPAYVYTGNPTFPLFNGVFKSPRMEAANWVMDSGTFGLGTTPAALLRLPFRLTFDTGKFGAARGTLGPLFPLGIVFGLMLIPAGWAVRSIMLISGIYLALWTYSFQYGRYFLAILPFIAIVAVAGALPASKIPERIGRCALFGLFVVQVALFPGQHWQIPDRIPLHLAFGLESREEFLHRAIPGYEGTVGINNSIQPGQRVLGVQTESLRFYVKAPLDSFGETIGDGPLKHLNPEPEHLAEELANRNYAYMLVERSATIDPAPFYPYLAKAFLTRHAELKYSDPWILVYRLNRVTRTGPG